MYHNTNVTNKSEITKFSWNSKFLRSDNIFEMSEHVCVSVMPSRPLGIMATGLFTVEQVWAVLIKMNTESDRDQQMLKYHLTSCGITATSLPH